MGSLGVPEMIVIFLLALVLFGPKKLPEIGRTLGKAITEFRRASSELKETFTTEMQNLERETKSVKDAANEAAVQVNDQQYHYDNYNYDYSSYESQYEGTNGSETSVTDANPSSESASAPQGAESPSAEPPEGTIAHGAEFQTPIAGGEPGESHSGIDPSSHETASTSAEHKA